MRRSLCFAFVLLLLTELYAQVVACSDGTVLDCVPEFVSRTAVMDEKDCNVGAEDAGFLDYGGGIVGDECGLEWG